MLPDMDNATKRGWMPGDPSVIRKLYARFITEHESEHHSVGHQMLLLIELASWELSYHKPGRTAEIVASLDADVWAELHCEESYAMTSRVHAARNALGAEIHAYYAAEESEEQ